MLTEDEEAGIRMSRSPSTRGGGERMQLIKRHNWMEGSRRRGAMEALCYNIEAQRSPKGGIIYACSRTRYRKISSDIEERLGYPSRIRRVCGALLSERS